MSAARPPVRARTAARQGEGSPVSAGRGWWKGLGLQARVLSGGLLATGAVWLGAAVFTWFEAAHELDELLDAHLSQSAAILVAQHSGDAPGTALPGEVPPGRSADAPVLHRYASQVAFQVWRDGRLVLRSAHAPAQDLGDASGERRDGFRTVRIDGEQWRVFSARPSRIGLRVVVGERTQARRHILWELMEGMLMPLALALPFLAVALWWAVRQGMGSLRVLSAQLRDRRPDALEPVNLLHAPGELRPLIAALNQLLARTARLLESERRFTADAAHELRTPLAALRAQAQVAKGAQSDPERQHALGAVLQGCDRASRVVEQLLTLARLEAQGHPASPDELRVEVASVVREVAAELGSQALQQAQRLELEAEPGLAVSAEPVLLGVLVRNLLDNALRYTPAHGQVRLRVRRHEGRALLEVEDSGPGMREPDLARLGERFFRVLGHDASGSGLGWSIVRRIAAVQGARVDVGRSTQLGGLRVQVSWALA